MRRHKLQSVALPAVNGSPFGVADANGVLQYSLKHRLQLARRRAYDPQYFRGGSLLFQQFGELASALLLGLEQPHVLDRDHRLVGESRHQVDLHVGEGVHFIAGEGEDADRCPLAQERHTENGSEPECLLVAARAVFGIG